MIIKCPKCAERFEIEAAWQNQRGICPHCQSTILFSNRKSPMISQTLYGSDSEKNSDLQKVGIIVAVIGLTLAFICASLSKCYGSRASKYTSRTHSSSYQRNDRNIDFEKEQARNYVNSLPEEQRRAFYGGSSNSADKTNLITNILESGNLEGAIKLLENN